MTYTPTGQKILFRGLDDPLKVASITVEHGVLCWLWIVEAYEISSKEDFDTLNESIRGEMPEGLFRQITLTFNPWNERHWLKKRFFDNPPDPEDVFTLTTDYRCNEWLSADDLKLFETMKKENPRRYAVAGLGEWGIVDGFMRNSRSGRSTLTRCGASPASSPLLGLILAIPTIPPPCSADWLTRRKRLFTFSMNYTSAA